MISLLCVLNAFIIGADQTHDRPVLLVQMHMVFAFVGFAMSLLWIYTSSEEIVNVIMSFGVVFDVGRSVLGITVTYLFLAL